MDPNSDSVSSNSISIDDSRLDSKTSTETSEAMVQQRYIGSFSASPDTFETKHVQPRDQERALKDFHGIHNFRRSDILSTREKLQHLYILLVFLDSIPIDQLHAVHADTIQDQWLIPWLDKGTVDVDMSTFSVSTFVSRLSTYDHYTRDLM